MAIHLYGIPNCDSVRKARKWLETHGVEYEFHDFKKEGADPAKLATWIDAEGVDTVLNRRGTTFRKLSEVQKADIDPAKAAGLLQEYPSMIKRPVVEYAGGLLIGFREAEWEAAFQ